ncbi:MAG: Ig-like domain-containing protein, partial [Anaerolineae bacterium]
MNIWKRLLYVTVLVAILAFPLGCGSREALPTPIPTLVQKAAPSVTPRPTVAPTATPAPPRAPRLLEQTPAVGEELGIDEPVVLVFDQPMDAASVEEAFSVSPELKGTFVWPDSSTLRFVPDSASLQRDGQYVFTIATAARSQQNLPLAREVAFRQRVVGYLEV